MTGSTSPPPPGPSSPSATAWPRSWARRVGRGGLPWNREKSFAGTLALFLCGGVAGAIVAWWCRPNVTPQPDVWFSIAAPLVAALVAALVETIPIKLDDNVSVPASAAAVLWALSLVRAELVWPAVLTGGQAIALATAANVVVAWLGYRAGMVTTAGAVTGALIGIAIAVTTGWPGWTLLLATFLAASISSRLGLRRKTHPRHRRGARWPAGSRERHRQHGTRDALPRCWQYRRCTATSRSWPSSPPWPRAGATRLPVRSARRGAVARISCPRSGEWRRARRVRCRSKGHVAGVAGACSARGVRASPLA